MSHSNQSRKNVVVVGGGQAGVETVKLLSKTLDGSQYRLILINPLPYRILLIATLRAVVSDRDNLENKIFFPFDKEFHEGNGEFIQASVVSIQDQGKSGGSVVLDNGETVSYHVLILAPGSTWPGPSAFPNDPNQVKDHIYKLRERFAKAQHVVIVGGGAIGIETAGEIRDVWPDKKVTLIHSGTQLLNATYPDRFRRKALTSMQNRDINVILGDQVDGISDVRVVEGVITRQAQSIPDADLVVPCFGPRPNTGFIASSLADAVTSAGLVSVRPTLQLKSYPHIFAVGDVIDWKEQKQAAKTGAHASVVAENVLALLTDSDKPLKIYKGSKEMIVITNGSEGGLVYLGILWGIVLGDWVASRLKSRTLFLP